MVWAGYGDIGCGISTTCSGTFKVFLSANINLCMYKIDVHFDFIYKVLYYVPSIYDRRQGGILVVHLSSINNQ